MQDFEYRTFLFDWYRGTFPLRGKDLAVAAMLRRDGVTPETVHSCCLLGFVALKTRVATVDEVLGDFGLVHEAAHAMHIGEPDHTAETVAAIAEKLEERIGALSDGELRAGFVVVDHEAELGRIRRQLGYDP